MPCSLARRVSQLSTYNQSSSSAAIPATKLKRIVMMRKTYCHSCSSLSQRMAVLSQVEICLAVILLVDNSLCRVLKLLNSPY